MIVAGVASAGCSQGADVVVENRCAVDIWVRATSWTGAGPDAVDGNDPVLVAAGATVRLRDEVTKPPELPADPGTISVSGQAEAVGRMWPLPYVEADERFHAVVEGPQCP